MSRPPNQIFFIAGEVNEPRTARSVIYTMCNGVNYHRWLLSVLGIEDNIYKWTCTRLTFAALTITNNGGAHDDRLILLA